MNKNIIILAFFTLLIGSCGKSSNTVIEGKLTNAERKALTIEYLNINNTVMLDSIRIKKNGDFRFKILVEQPGIYILKNESGKIINLLITPGEKISIDGDYKEMDKKYTVKGSHESENIRQLVEKLTDTRSKLKALDAGYRENPNLTENQLNDYYAQKALIIKQQRDFSISFIIEHLSSISSIYALYQKISPEELVLNENKDIQFMKIVADSLTKKYPQSTFVSTFVKDARTAEKRYYNMMGLQKKILEAQDGLPDISYPDPNGNIRKLSSLKGKTVLLYFWSAYSKESTQLNPIFEKTYRKYKNKGFEIFAVCIDQERDNWLKLIKFDELSFINTIGSDFADSDLARTYNVRAIPANYLIDKEGNIISRDIYGAELETWLDNKL